MHEFNLIETHDSCDKNSEDSCTNFLLKSAQDMVVSNRKVQRQELTNKEMELGNNMDEEDKLEWDNWFRARDLKHADIESKATFLAAIYSELDPLKVGKPPIFMRNHKGSINQLYGATKKVNSKSVKANPKRKLTLNEWKETLHDACENSRVYRKRTKVHFHKSKLHLFPRKLRSRGTEHFIVKTVNPHGAVRVQNQKNGKPFKFNWKYLKPFLGNFISEVESTPLKDPI